MDSQAWAHLILGDGPAGRCSPWLGESFLVPAMQTVILALQGPDLCRELCTA